MSQYYHTPPNIHQNYLNTPQHSSQHRYPYQQLPIRNNWQENEHFSRKKQNQFHPNIKNGSNKKYQRQYDTVRMHDGQFQTQNQSQYVTSQRNPIMSYQTPRQNHNQYQNYQSNNGMDSFPSTTKIDYKAKTFQLMQVVTEMQIRHKDMQKNTLYLQRQLQIIHKELEQFLLGMGYSSLRQVRENYQKIERQLQKTKSSIEKPLIKEEKLTQEYEKILSEYKLILKTQEDKLIKYQQKWKQKQHALNEQVQNLTKENKGLKQQIQLNQKNYEIKNQELKMTIQRELSKKIKQETQNLLLQQYQKKLDQQKSHFNLTIEKLKRQIDTSQEQIKIHQEQQAQLKQQLLTQQEQSKKIKDEKSQLESQSKQYKQDIQLMKQQFREIILQKQSLQEKHQKLKRKYKQEIEHFQVIQKEVEQKLIEVQKEITFYKEERELHLEQIHALKNQIAEMKSHIENIQSHEDQFSFGGDNHVQTQTEADYFVDKFEENQQASQNCDGKNQSYDQKEKKAKKQSRSQDDEQDEMMMTSECYQISIKSLLQENNRLKRTLILLERSKSGQELPPQAELELKLLKGLTKNILTSSAYSSTKSGSNVEKDEKSVINDEKQLAFQKQAKKKSTEHLAIDLIDESSQQHINQLDFYSPKFRHQIIDLPSSKQQQSESSMNFLKIKPVTQEEQ